MKNKKMKWTTAGALASVAFCANAAAQSSDALLDKLVQKGILSSQEAKDLREDAKKDFDKNYRKETSMPDWSRASGLPETFAAGSKRTTRKTICTLIAIAIATAFVLLRSPR